MASWPDFDPNQPGEAADRRPDQPRRADRCYEMGSTFKAFTVGHRARHRRGHARLDLRRPRARSQLGYRTINDYHAARKILTLRRGVPALVQHRHRQAWRIGRGRAMVTKYFNGLGLTDAGARSS